MTAATVGNLTVPDAASVYMLCVNLHRTNADFFLSRPARWELVAEMICGSGIVVDVAKTKESAFAKTAEYARKLGLHMIAPGFAVRRSNIVATFVAKSGIDWQVMLRFNVGPVDFLFSMCDSYDAARASLDAINSILFPSTAAAAATATPQ